VTKLQFLKTSMFAATPTIQQRSNPKVH